MSLRPASRFISSGPRHGTETGTMLSVQQVAAQLSVSRSLVYDEIKRGNLPAKRIGKCIRISARDLDAFVHSYDGDQKTAD